MGAVGIESRLREKVDLGVNLMGIRCALQNGFT